MARIVPISEFKTSDSYITKEIINTGAKEVLIKVLDPREISSVQRRKARAIIADIGRWSGNPPDYLHDFLKYDFCTKKDTQGFSLSDTDVTTARLYISYLIDFCLYHSVPLKNPVLDMCHDQEQAIYSCLRHKKCLLSGLKSQLHHVDTVGAGRNRKTIIHEGMRVQPLSAKYHVECHQTGQETFNKKYHAISLKLDKYLCSIYGLGYEAD